MARLEHAYADVIRRKGQECEKKFGDTPQEAAMQIQDLRRRMGPSRGDCLRIRHRELLPRSGLRR